MGKLIYNSLTIEDLNYKISQEISEELKLVIVLDEMNDKI